MDGNFTAKCRMQLILVLLMLASACQGQVAGTNVWIDVPINNLSLSQPGSIKIEGHASSPQGIARVEILVNGVQLEVISEPEMVGNLAYFQTPWSPTEAGSYVIQAIAFGVDGSTSELDSALVVIAEKTATPSPTETPPVPSPTTTLTPTLTESATVTNTIIPTVAIQFWAEPASISAGSCTNLRWNVINALKLVFGGINQPLSGADDECPCTNQDYSLTVTGLDGHEQVVYAHVNVTGTCAESDTTPPPAPTLFIPTNGLSLSCRSTQVLTWLPVTDPSGIAEYQVQVQRSTDNATWSTAPGSPINGLTQKTTSINTECGWYYRWRVRAVDGKGNIGAWSGWWNFSIVLG